MKRKDGSDGVVDGADAVSSGNGLASDDLEAGAPIVEEGAGPQTDPSIEQLEEELDSARDELSHTMDQFRRLAADFDNYRKRIERERVETSGRAQADLVKRLLDVIDDFERVAAINEETPIIEGVRLVQRKLMQVLEAAGLENIEAEGAAFDPSTMEGLATVPTENPDEDDRVADVFQKGYAFKGQLLRPARVRVKKFEA
ncbi:MAG: nucleotide exchange factor GrpE [Gemmatimonadetes bacterium]|nr:nucleotide exchange factor GrpE [Gemmatimonadota bacterium]